MNEGPVRSIAAGQRALRMGWRRQDSNLGRLSRQIYSGPPLALSQPFRPAHFADDPASGMRVGDDWGTAILIDGRDGPSSEPVTHLFDS
jgi:hypothetical protein